MGHKNEKTLVRQVQEKYQSMLSIGQSKHADKKAGDTQDKIYSFATYRAYMKSAAVFARFCKEYKCKNLANCRKYVNSWLQHCIDKDYSASTIKLYSAALAKLYSVSTTEFLPTPTRLRVNITRSRGAKIRDKHFSEESHKDYVTFCRCTGLRRNEAKSLKVTLEDNHIRIIDGEYYISITQGTKGGKPRLSRIMAENEGELNLVLNTLKKASGYVFPKIPNGADTHSYRADYAKRVYNHYKRDFVPQYERIITFHNRPLKTYVSTGYYPMIIGNENYYKWSKSKKRYELRAGYKDSPSKYICRKDRKTVVFDRQALFYTSLFLGHYRVSVCAENYLYNI